MSLAPPDPSREIDRLDTVLAQCVARRDELRATSDRNYRAAEKLLDDATTLDGQADAIEDRLDTYLGRRLALMQRLERQKETA